MKRCGATAKRTLAASRSPLWPLIASTAGALVLAAAIAVAGGDAAWHAARAHGHAISDIDARVIVVNIPGAAEISQVEAVLSRPATPACAHPMPSLFQPGAVLDPNRILVASRSNFGAPLAASVGREGSLLSIDPSGPDILRVPADFAQSGVEASALGGAVQMLSANSPDWLNGVNNPVSGSCKAVFGVVSADGGIVQEHRLGGVNGPTTRVAGSDFYIADRGNNTIVRMGQGGNVVAIRHVPLDHGPLGDARLNGIATSTDAMTIYVTFTGPGEQQGGVLALPAF